MVPARFYSLRMLGRILCVGFVAALAVRVTAQPCTDVRKFDFKNSDLRIGGQSAESRELDHSIGLHNGTGFVSDDPTSKGSGDWEITIRVDRVVRQNSSTWVRVFVLDQNHLTGTGDWRSVLVFGCANGSLVRLFQYASEGVALEHTDGRTIRLYQGQWKRSDAHCCPSRHFELVYEWDVGERRYRRKAFISGDGFELPTDEK